MWPFLFFSFFFCKSVLKWGFFVPQHASEGVWFAQRTISPSQNVMSPLTHKRSLAGCLLHAVFEQVDSSNKKWDCFLFCDYGFVQYCCSYWKKRSNLGVNNNKVRSSRSIWNEFHILCEQFLLATPKQHLLVGASSEYVVCTQGNCWNLVSVCICFSHWVWHRLCAVSWCLFGVLSLARVV